MLRKTCLWSGCAVAMALWLTAAAPSLAQDDEGPAAQVSPEPIRLEELVVTGTRIRKPGLVSSSPLVQVEAEEVALQGTVRVEDMLRTLPQVFSNQNTGQSNGATGTATVNLRNLGTQRGLVLVNGRRLPAGSPIQGGIGADINQIPSALIDSVEVLTGGASATYGSDAVAGVVNFRLMDDFEGVRLDYQFSQYQHGNRGTRWQRLVRDAGYETADGSAWDGAISTVSLLMGRDLDAGRGNVTVYGTWRDIDAVRQGSRDYSSCALSNDLTGCSGSATQPQGTFSDFGVLKRQGLEGFDYMVEGDRFVPRQGTTYNYGPSNYFQRPDKRWTAGALARYDLRDRIEAYAEIMLMDDRSLAQIAPSGAFFVTDSLGCGNPFLSPQQFDALCGRYGLTADDTQTVRIGRRNVEGGSRQNDLHHTSWRSVFGLRGDFTDEWRYDLYYQYAEVRMQNAFLNELSTSRIRRALDAVPDPETGQVVCRSVLDGSDPACVPWNIFREGAVTQEMVDYLALPLFSRGTTDQTVVSGYVAGYLGEYGFTSPYATTGLDVVAGVEYRAENLDYEPDQAYRSGDGAGQGGASQPVSGGFDVAEFFVEAGLPLVEDAPWAEELDLNAGYRFSAYDYGKQANTYGIRAGWALNGDVRLRSSFQRAIRGPSVREQFLPQGFNLFDMSADPCGGAVTGGRTAAGRTFDECARSGVTRSQFGSIPDSPAGQYNFLQGGNPDLSPEESDTYAYGLIWTPRFVEGFSLSLDFYSIRLRKAINTVTPEFILNECLDGNDAQCAKVRRGQSGDLWLGSDVASSGHVVSLLDNLAIVEVQGYDVTAGYDLDVGDWGRLRLSDILSITTMWDQQELAGAPKVACAGKWGATCRFPKPDIRNHLRVTWQTPWGLRPSLGWRYISSIEDLSATRIDLGARQYFDLAAIWDYSDSTAIRVGVNNLFDKAPPVVGSGLAGPSIGGNGNTFPGLYDALGRYLFIGLSVGFS